MVLYLKLQTISVQTIKHIIEICSLTKYEGGTEGLHKGDSEAEKWLRSLEVRH